MLILVRYGEIGVKSSQVKRKFEKRLMENLERKLESKGIEGGIFEREGRIFAEVPEEDAADASIFLSNVPGVVSTSPVLASEVSIDDIEETVLEVVQGEEPGTFAVDASRAGEHGFTSEDIEEEVGQTIVDEKGWDVDLENPDLTVHVEARYSHAYVYTKEVDGVGGLPVNDEEKVAVLMQDRASTVAAFLLVKRGCKVFPVYTGSETEDLRGEMRILRQYDPDVKLTVLEEEGLEAVEEVAELYNCKAAAFPDTAEDLKEENPPESDMEVLLPNCGLSDREVLEKYRSLTPAYT